MSLSEVWFCELHCEEQCMFCVKLWNGEGIQCANIDIL